METNPRRNNKKTLKNKTKKNITMDNQHFKDRNIPNNIFRQNTKISSSKRKRKLSQKIWTQLKLELCKRNFTKNRNKRL